MTLAAYELSPEARRMLGREKHLARIQVLFHAPIAVRDPVRPSPRNPKLQVLAGLLLKQVESGAARSLSWGADSMDEENDPDRYFAGARLVLAGGEVLEGAAIAEHLRRVIDLTNSGDEARLFPEVTGHTVTDGGEGRVIVEHGGRRWEVEVKLVLTPAQLEKLAAILVRLVPPGRTCSLQADSHCAGSIFVGMVVCWDGVSIPICLPSADIGCGVTMLPVVDAHGRHMKAAPRPEERATFNRWAMLKARASLKRGRCAEKGEAVHSVHLVRQALRYYSESSDASRFLDEMRATLAELGMLPPKPTKARSKYEDSLFGGLDTEQIDLLLYVCGFAGTLGSSGNHFLELAEDKHGCMWWVAHSGSRALGAMIYKAVLGLSAALGTAGVATGHLARVYARAYNALSQFASINRALCALLVADAMGLETDGATLRTCLRESELFSPAFAVCEGDAGSSADLAVATDRIAVGLTHNGIAAFYNALEHTLCFVAVKGAIALGPTHCGIVACKAGDGCVVFASVARSDVREVAVEEALRLLAEGATVVSDLERFGGITLAGHGAGRRQSASATFGQFTHADLAEYCRERGVTINLGPNVRGDHPDGYKDTGEIKDRLPLDTAAVSSDLVTLMSFKENIDHRAAWIERFVAYVRGVFAAHRERPDHAAWAQCDWELGYRALEPAEVADMREAARVTHDHVGEAYRAAFAQHCRAP